MNAAGGVNGKKILHREAVERVIDLVELERYRHAVVGALPFGVQKLVGFARALALEPKVMLLDEPSAGLNREERENLARFILRIKHELKMTIVWIEHDMQMIADLADRIHVLDHGRTIADGPPKSVLSDPNVLTAYLGTADQCKRTPGVMTGKASRQRGIFTRGAILQTNSLLATRNSPA